MGLENIKYTVGQKWVELEADAYTSAELRKIADVIDEHYKRAFSKPTKKSIENNGDKK